MNKKPKEKKQKLDKARGGIYTAEKLLKRRVTEDGGIEYFVKWLKWGKKYNTWEPERNILDHSKCAIFRPIKHESLDL